MLILFDSLPYAVNWEEPNDGLIEIQILILFFLLRIVDRKSILKSKYQKA